MSDYVGKTASATIIRVAAFFLTLGFFYLYVRDIDQRSPAFNDASLAALIAVGVFVSIYVGGLILNLLFVVPAILWREQDNQIAELQTKLTPVLSFSMENNGEAIEFPKGEVQDTASGDYVTNQTGSEYLICARVQNLSSIDVVTAEVTLLKLTGDKGRNLRDPLGLGWLNGRYSGGTEIVPANGNRTAQLFRVTDTGVYFAGADKLSLEHATFFQGADTEYRGRVALSGYTTGPLYVDILLKLGGSPQCTILAME